MKRIFVIIPLLFLLGASFAQDQVKDEEVKLKKFDEQKWKEIVGDETFEEVPEKEEEAKPWKPWFKIPGMNPALSRALSFALIFAIFAFILYYVALNTKFRERVRTTKPLDATAPVENIEDLDIDGLLRDALANGDLRLAVRVHFLLLLKKLNEAGLISWKKDKTNRDYLSELYGRNACYDDVRELTLVYELVWYGERSVSSESFQQLSSNFEAVNRQVQSQPTP